MKRYIDLGVPVGVHRSEGSSAMEHLIGDKPVVVARHLSPESAHCRTAHVSFFQWVHLFFRRHFGLHFSSKTLPIYTGRNNRRGSPLSLCTPLRLHSGRNGSADCNALVKVLGRHLCTPHVETAASSHVVLPGIDADHPPCLYYLAGTSGLALLDHKVGRSGLRLTSRKHWATPSTDGLTAKPLKRRKGT